MKCQCCDSEPCLEALDNAMQCIHCGQPVSPARWEIGRNTCPPCGSANAVSDVARDYRLVLNPKQGFGIVSKDSPDLLNGKSSGRQ
jgi:hypothetical protein